MAKKAKKLAQPVAPENSAGIGQGPIKARTAAFCSDRVLGFRQMLAAMPKTKGAKARAASEDPIAALAAYRVSQLQAFRQLAQVQESPPAQKEKGKKSGQKREAIAPPPANNWIPIGPSVVRQGQVANRTTTSGRVRGIAASPDGRRVYAATANGGVWHSDNQGDTWISLMDRYDENPIIGTPADTLACGAMVAHFKTHSHEDFLVIGSGEGTINIDRYFGVGPIISRDGGANWQTEAAGGASTPLLGQGFFELAMHPQNPESIVGATTTGVYRREPIPGSNNRWHWVQKALPGSAANAVVSSVVVAEDPGTRAVTFYAASCANYAGTPAAGFVGIYSSPDGHTWTAMPLPAGLTNISQRITLAIQPNNPNVVYAFCQNGQLWRFAAGAPGVWRQVGGPNMPAPASVIGTQGWYDLTIAVAPDNVNRVYLGGSTQSANAAGALGPGEFAGAVWRLDLTVAPASVTVATANYIGGSVHADCHVLVFTPGNANQLWVGCDGGVFFSSNPTANGMVFVSKNNGLQTLCINRLTNHPNHESTVFCGTQDNGGLRGTGEAVWLYSSPGDCSGMVINRTNPYQVIAQYFGSTYRIGSDGVGRDPNYANYNAFAVPLAGGDSAYFYAPLIGTPAGGNPNRVAFGSQFVHLSDNFAANGSWNTLPGANLGGQVRSLCFQSNTKLYAGVDNGTIIRYDETVPPAAPGTLGTWTITQLNTLGGGAALPATPVTCIFVDPADATGNSIYATFGGFTNFQHVWHFDGANWTARSGPAAGAATALLNIQFNSIVVDPRHAQILYAGADIGIWRSLNSGAIWHPFSQGLPDAPVLDLKIFHDAARNVTLLRSGLHGRGIFERDLNLDPAPGVVVAPPPIVPGVQLYIRSTQTDSGRYPLNETLQDPVNPAGTAVNRFSSPDIRLDAPDPANGRLRQAQRLNFVAFTDQLTDQSNAVAAHATARFNNRVHVQVHNRGVLKANDVTVTLLIAPVTGALPNPNLPLLPNNYPQQVQSGAAISNNDWRTAGSVRVHGVGVSYPQVAGFDLSTELLRQVAGPGGNTNFVLLALIHHADDAFPAAGVADPNALVRGERLAAMKLLQTTAYAGVAPDAPPLLATIPGYVTIPASATAAGAPLDALLLRALRQNDHLFATLLENLAVTPQGFAYTAGSLTNPSTNQWVSADQIRLEATATVQPGVPMCWMAKEKIYFNALLEATGAGVAAGAAGDFGGSGGAAGAGADGGACRNPVTLRNILTAATGTANGIAADEAWASRALLALGSCMGGAGGGGTNGGRGGGVVCLFAPIIEFGPNGRIQANGGNGTSGNAGGGGGGMVVLMANRFINVNKTDPNRNVFVDKGNHVGTAGDGGDGIVLQITVI